MKRIHYILSCASLLALSLSSSAAVGASRPNKGDITIISRQLEQKADSLYVSMDFVLNDLTVQSTRSEDYIPVLSTQDKELKMPKLTIKGRNSYKSHERFKSLLRKWEIEEYDRTAPYAIVKGYKNCNDTIHYTQVLPYEPWMADAHLDLQKDECGCGNSRSMSMQRLSDHVSTEPIIVVEPYTITPSLAYIQPKVEIEKRRDVQTEASLDFVVGKTDIRPEYMNNPVELGKIRSMIDELRADKYIEVKKLSIIGYASPEGSLASNKRLSEGRAYSLSTYLSSIYYFPRNSYNIVFGGENWDGLVKYLKNGYYSYGNSVIGIIESTSLDTDRKKKIKALGNGAPYREMVRDIYPRLRTAICKVDYTVKNFEVTEAMEVIKTAPQNLSLSEMYAVANQYERGSKEFNDVFETAVHMFPGDETASLNAAAASLERGELVTAERHLGKVTDRTPEYENALGVLEMLKGEFDKAESLFKSAQKAGLEEAGANLEQIAKKRANLEEMAAAEEKNLKNPNYKK